MIRGAHVVLFSTDAEADKAFLRDVLEFPFVDAGHNWLIFALPSAELAVHPADANDQHELFLMCDDIDAFTTDMAARGVACSEPHRERWGTVTRLTLPGGGTVGVYQPAHPSPDRQPTMVVTNG
jgi:catechol 2,3-dioxygenase-like lactoylglutathione lyase family enzyme